jgi:peptidoglycan/xylan/chitin deacetylase (PgdA/CDA1 family)
VSAGVALSSCGAETHPDTTAPEAAAIDRVLRYTPYMTFGGDRLGDVALTFDDGPDRDTKSIVSVLRRENVPATFFDVGQRIKSAPQLAALEVRDGFAIGDHTQTHPSLNQLSPVGQEHQLSAAAEAIRSSGAPYPRMFRPPYGVVDAATMRIARRLQMLVVMWSVDPKDWQRPGSRLILERVLAGVHPGAVVLLHDGGGDRSQTVVALPAIIRHLRAEGYRLVTVPQMLLEDPPSAEQEPWAGISSRAAAKPHRE